MRPQTADERWRQSHLGELLRRASLAFEHRVMAVMAVDLALSMVLTRLAARGRLTACHVQITRHLPLEGCGLTELARRAGISKQAMGRLVDQCEAWGLVRREPHERDNRAIQIRFTEDGAAWLQAYARAVDTAQREFGEAIGAEVATVTRLGLEVYGT
jgi:DNA-binding MarR family transcriptional regulator